MHPVQAAPRQSVIHLLAAMDMDGCTPCRQRRGKEQVRLLPRACRQMHPVQAAPRQRPACRPRPARSADAPRAGSAEAKGLLLKSRDANWVMHPVQAAPRQRRAPAASGNRCAMHPVQAAPRQRAPAVTRRRAGDRCTPCRQRRGKVNHLLEIPQRAGCTPCRQRRGKGQGRL